MQTTRDIVTRALEPRDKAGVKVRQPLQKLTIGGVPLTEEYLALIRGEVNVKEVVIGAELVLETSITPALQEEGIVRDIIRLVQDARKVAKMKPGERALI